ncbi:MAG: RNA polymerase sigma factor [Oscillochloris sp.]|nr:RNA polymerase sigma factor [Oscillochloris sp.]
MAWCQQTLPDDTRAFEALVNRYKGHVFALAYRLMGDPQEAEDQAQEVFLKIYRGIARLDDPATLPAWITRITVNTCFDALEHRRRRPRTVPIDSPRLDTPAENTFIDTRAPTPEEAVLQAELRHCLERTLTKIEPSERVILILRDLEDRPYQEIADTLKLGLSAVKMRIHRARLTFQRLLEQVCPESWQRSAQIGHMTNQSSHRKQYERYS